MKTANSRAAGFRVAKDCGDFSLFENGAGHVVHQYAADIGTFDFTYDLDARHNTCTGTDGYLLELWYDEFGRITAAKDAGGTESITYNLQNQVTSRTDRAGYTTSYAHKVTQFTDRNGSASS